MLKKSENNKQKKSGTRYDLSESIKNARETRAKMGRDAKPFNPFDPRREPFAGNKKRNAQKPGQRKFVKSKKPRVASASWGSVASWYDKHLLSKDTYHEKVVLPNLLRLVEAEEGQVVLDLACGQGFFTRAFAEKGRRMVGVDISEELIAIARKQSPEITYHVGSAEKLSMFKNASIDHAVIVLAIQNIEDAGGVFREAARVLKKEGTLNIVMNHPAFRIPKQSTWGYDEKEKVQYRRIEQYLSESRAQIEMHPGMKDSPQTLSYHRPLQYYFKALAKAGFAVECLEEWISHKDSDSGPRARAENRSRKEIPLFLYMRARKTAH